MEPLRPVPTVDTDEEIQVLSEIDKPKQDGLVPYKFKLQNTEARSSPTEIEERAYKLIITFGDDRTAMTTDPTLNYMIPWSTLNIQNGKFTIQRTNENGMLIVSPEFVSNYLGGTPTDWFKQNSVNGASQFESTDHKPVNHKLHEVPNHLNPVHQPQIKPPVVQNGASPDCLGISSNSKAIKKLHQKQSPPKRAITPNRNGPILPFRPNPQKQDPPNAEEDLDNMTVSEFKTPGTAVNLSSLKRLLPNEELNDDLVDFGIYYFIQNLTSVAYVRASAWSLYIGTPQVKPNHMDTVFKIITRNGADKRVLAKKYILIPVNRDHWFLAVICSPFPKEKDVQNAEDLMARGLDPHKISAQLYKKWTQDPNPPMVFVLDSKYEFLRHKYEFTGFHASTAKYAIRVLKHIHQRLWLSRGSPAIPQEEVFETDANDFCHQIAYHSLRVPPQGQGNDCGLFCFKNTFHWFESMVALSNNYVQMVNKDCTGWFDPSPQKMEILRQWTYVKILENCETHRPGVLNHVIKADPWGFVAAKFGYKID